MKRYEPYGTIVAAAIYRDGFIYSVPAPGRHHDVFRLMSSLNFSWPIDGEQGFLTSTGHFVRRKPAMLIAMENGQIKEPSRPYVV